MLRSSRSAATQLQLPVKLALMFAAAILVMIAALLVLQRIQGKTLAALKASEVQERSEILAEAIPLTSRPLLDFAEDYANWDDMVRFVATPKLRWAKVNLETALESFQLSGVWVLRTDASVVFGTRGEGKGPTPPVPLAAPALSAILAKPPADSFYVQLPDRLVELYLAPVQPSDDLTGETQPQGWLLAERTWDAKVLQLLSHLTQSKGRLAAPGQPLPPVEPHQFALRHPLLGADGKPAADFVYVVESAELQITEEHNRKVLLVLVLCGLALALLVIITIYRWVLRPVATVVRSLVHDNADSLAPVIQRRDEIGQLARVVETSFAQREELQRTLAERTRLGRELHDGAIQTVFAAGMSLGGVRSTLRRDPAAAEKSIDEIREGLNQTIRELRDFINGLEAEPTQPSHFSAAVRSILALLQGVRPIAVKLEIDDSFADQLSAQVRLQLLQFIREVATNCVRHSQARSLAIKLDRELEVAKLEISDDGVGLPASAEVRPGRGLANLADRSTELGGKLQLISLPGQGLKVQLDFACAGAAPS